MVKSGRKISVSDLGQDILQVRDTASHATAHPWGFIGMWTRPEPDLHGPKAIGI